MPSDTLSSVRRLRCVSTCGFLSSSLSVVDSVDNDKTHHPWVIKLALYRFNQLVFASQNNEPCSQTVSEANLMGTFRCTRLSLHCVLCAFPDKRLLYSYNPLCQNYCISHAKNCRILTASAVPSISDLQHHLSLNRWQWLIDSLIL